MSFHSDAVDWLESDAVDWLDSDAVDWLDRLVAEATRKSVMFYVLCGVLKLHSVSHLDVKRFLRTAVDCCDDC